MFTSPKLRDDGYSACEGSISGRTEISESGIAF